jgi:hypothetical protein
MSKHHTYVLNRFTTKTQSEMYKFDVEKEQHLKESNIKFTQLYFRVLRI